MARLLPVLLLLAVAGCDLVGGDGPPRLPALDADASVAAETPAALAAARAHWERLAMTDYEMSYSRSCFCAPQEVQVRVEGGQIVEAWINGEPVPEDPAFDLLTLDRLFEMAAGAFETAAGVDVRVLPEAPFLYSVSIDYVAEIADDEVGFTVTGFRRTS